jgi:hypothetical protein
MPILLKRRLHRVIHHLRRRLFHRKVALPSETIERRRPLVRHASQASL